MQALQLMIFVKRLALVVLNTVFGSANSIGNRTIVVAEYTDEEIVYLVNLLNRLGGEVRFDSIRLPTLERRGDFFLAKAIIIDKLPALMCTSGFDHQAWVNETFSL